MTESPHLPPAAEADPFPFIPVPVRARHDGWTPDRQRDFIAALAVMGVVARAAKAVGLSASAAHKLRERPDAKEFAAAWDRAQDEGRKLQYGRAIEEALYGVETPRFWRGKQVGTYRRFDTRLMIAALSVRPPSAGDVKQRASQAKSSTSGG